MLPPGSSICQSVAVNGGCCYTLSFAASVRGSGVLTATVQFFAVPPAVCTPPANPAMVPNLVAPAAHNDFWFFEFVVCAPAGTTSACICFAEQGQGAASVAFVDNVAFHNTGGPCNC
ncbi:MAG: collagen triple helix repeat family protein [Firmicutes bacterium]|nr:collagen triple helix repeat family protein [Bacillota bacterium]